MIWLILVVGLVYRLISLNQSLWLDEGIVVQLVKTPSLVELVTQRAWYDLHPPGYHILLWGWTQLFGWSEISLRMPSVLMGVATIGVVYLIGRELVSRKVGLIAGWLVAINPLLLYYSQEARMYQMATFGVALHFYYFVRLIQGKRCTYGLILSSLIVLLSDYVAYFSFLAELVALLVWYRAKLKDWLRSLVPGALIWLWWLPIFVKQVTEAQSAAALLPVWQKVVGGFEIKTLGLTGVKMMLGRISLVDKGVYGVVAGVSGLIYLSVVARSVWWQWQQVKVVLVMALVPVLVAWLGSLALPIFSYFRVLFCVPFVALVLAIGLSEWRRWGAVLTVVISFISLVSGGYYLTNAEFQREDWRGTVRFLSQKQLPESAVMVESNGSFAPYDYYGGRLLKTIFGLERIPANSRVDLIDLEAELAHIKQVYLLEYLIDITDPKRLLGAQLGILGWKEVAIYDFHGVGFVREWVRQE